MLIGGPTAVYRTVVHVETFVELHYNEQSTLHTGISSLFNTRFAFNRFIFLPLLTFSAVDWMTAASAAVGETGCNKTNNPYHLSDEDSTALRNLSSVLSACCADEVHHQHEAAAVAPPPAAADRVKVRFCCRLFI